MLPSWAQWRTCRVFRTLLADFAPMPRRAEELVTYMKYEISRGTALPDIDYHIIFCYLNSDRAPSTMLAPLAQRIVSDIMLGTYVYRCQLIDSLLSPFTYGALESFGVLVIETAVDTHLTVNMPYSTIYRLVQMMDGRDTLTKSLRKICNHAHQEGFQLCWQDFEDLHCHIEASRESSLQGGTETIHVLLKISIVWNMHVTILVSFCEGILML